MKVAKRLVIFLALGLSGCALSPPLLPGAEIAQEADPEKTIERLSAAVRDEPQAPHYRALLAKTIEAYVAQQIQQAGAALALGNLEAARQGYRNALRYHAVNPIALAGLEQLEVIARNRELLIQAREALQGGRYEVAKNLARTVLAKEPAQVEANGLVAEAELRLGRDRQAEEARLGAQLRMPVSMRFRDVPMRNIFEALSQAGEVNFIFDRDVNNSRIASLIASDTSIADALDVLLASNQLSKKILNANTVLIYPSTVSKIREYQDTVVRSFFLAHANAKETQDLLRGMGKIREVYLDERLNMVAVRDTPQAIRLAERLVTMVDRPDAEVMLAVEIMEVSASKLQELGIRFPTQFSAVGTTETNAPNTSGTVTLRQLQDLNSGGVIVNPNPALNLLRTDGSVNLLANPRIRVKNKEKARIHIGEKVPVITSNVTSTGVTSESVNYLDVGLKFDVEPVIRLSADVEMKVALEVSNIVNTITTRNGTVAYQLGSRNAGTVLRLKDGETQVLAGLISDAERTSANKLPGLGDLPLVGRLFSSNRDDVSKTEVILLITPTILRNVQRPEFSEAEFFAGTEGTAADQSLRLRPASSSVESSVGSMEQRTPAVPAASPPASPPPAPSGLTFPPLPSPQR
jgi:general secretion pathway protein D